MPFTEEQAPFFFGRDAEREIITANLMAASLTLFYGPSGVGKSSVLNAGVAHHLRQEAREADRRGPAAPVRDRAVPRLARRAAGSPRAGHRARSGGVPASEPRSAIGCNRGRRRSTASC